MADRMTDRDIGEIVKLRGLGFSQQEISKKIGFSQSSIAHRLRQLRKKALKNGVDKTFTGILFNTGVLSSVSLVQVK